MINTLQHIGLQVSEKDVDSFYLDVFHGKIERTFDLSKEVSAEIFNVDKNVEVVIVSVEGVDFEFFINDIPQFRTFAHVCFKSNRAKKIMERAIQKGYRTYSRKNSSTETCFIRDANNNLFEIKTRKE